MGNNVGYGKVTASGIVGAGCTLAILVADQILTSYGKPPISAELVGAFMTFATSLAVYLTPHDAVGGS